MKRPSYIPESFFNDALSELQFHQKHLEGLNPDSYFRMMWLDKVSYVQNLISDNLHLRDFYLENHENTQLLSAVKVLFVWLPDWHYDQKTSGQTDSKLALKASNQLLQAARAINDSSDLRLNAQLWFDSRIKEIISDVSRDALLPKGKEAKNAVLKMLFPNFLSNRKLVEDEYLRQADHITFGNFDLFGLIVDLSEFLEEIAPAALDKASTVRKINAEDAHIVYAAKKLKEVFNENSAPTKTHVRHISSLLSGVLKEEVSEDRVRKLIT